MSEFFCKLISGYQSMICNNEYFPKKGSTTLDNQIFKYRKLRIWVHISSRKYMQKEENKARNFCEIKYRVRIKYLGRHPTKLVPVSLVPGKELLFPLVAWAESTHSDDKPFHLWEKQHKSVWITITHCFQEGKQTPPVSKSSDDDSM